MKKTFLIFLGITSLSGFSRPAPEGPLPIKGALHHVGRLMPDLSYKDLAGHLGKLSDFSTAKALVISMNVIDCPLSQKYAPTFNKIAEEYAKRGIQFLLVNAAPNLTEAELTSGVAKLGYKVPYLLDPDQKIAATLHAQSTTDVFVLDTARTLVYRGPIDDQFGIGFALPEPKRNLLKDALNAILSNSQIFHKSYSSPGCALSLQFPQETTTGVTYHNRISRIVQYNCESCHRPGESGPFSLQDLKHLMDKSSMIKKVVGQGIMPPWFADSNVGTWANDSTLTDADKAALIYWINNGMALGDAKDASIPTHYAKGWNIGTPDLRLQAPTPFQVPDSGVVSYQHWVVETGLTEDKWVSGIEIRVKSPQVVHHVAVYLNYDPNEIPKPFAGYVPGKGFSIFSAGTAKKLPKGATLLFELHVTPNGSATEEQPELGLTFLDKAPRKELIDDLVFNDEFSIPPFESNYVVTAEKTFTEAGEILSFMPHMHLRGKTFQFELTYPDGTTKVVNRVPQYDFNWQLTYVAQTPIPITAGTKLKATAVFDNSSQNLNNPDPSATVTWGLQTTSEMMIGYITWMR